MFLCCLSASWQSLLFVIINIIPVIVMSSSHVQYWLPIFILIGIVGGVAGSAFNFLNLKASALRRTIRSPLLRAAELLALCLASALLFSSLPILFGCDGHKTAIALMDSENVRKLSTNEMVKCVTEKVSHQLIDNRFRQGSTAGAELICELGT